MSTEKLKEKLAEYELEKEDIEANDFAKEIEEEVAAFRLEVEKKYAAKRQVELNKIDNYLFLLHELISDSEEEDKVAEQTTKQVMDDEDDESPSIAAAPILAANVL